MLLLGFIRTRPKFCWPGSLMEWLCCALAVFCAERPRVSMVLPFVEFMFLSPYRRVCGLTVRTVREVQRPARRQRRRSRSDSVLLCATTARQRLRGFCMPETLSTSSAWRKRIRTLL